MNILNAISYEQLISGVVARMGLDSLYALQSSTQAALTEYLNTRIGLAWEWDQWPELSGPELRSVTIDGNGVRSIARATTGLDTIADVFGCYIDNPDATVSPRTEEWALRSDRIILDPKQAATALYVDYRPIPYQYTVSQWAALTSYAAGTLVWNASANGGDGNCYKALATNTNSLPTPTNGNWKLISVPWILAEYLKIAIYSDTLREDGQIDKADGEEQRAETALIRQSDKLSLRSGKSSGSYSVRTR